MISIQGVQSFKKKFRLYQQLHGFWRRNSLVIITAIAVFFLAGIFLGLFYQARKQAKGAIAWGQEYELRLSPETRPGNIALGDKLRQG